MHLHPHRYANRPVKKPQYIRQEKIRFLYSTLFWPVGCTDLYLGDLLQLWFSERWLVNSPCQLLSTQSTTTLKKAVQREHDLYLYQLSGSALSGSNRSKVWSAAEDKSLDVSLDSAFKYYCIYKGAERPDASKLKTFKTAI